MELLLKGNVRFSILKRPSAYFIAKPGEDPALTKELSTLEQRFAMFDFTKPRIIVEDTSPAPVDDHAKVKDVLDDAKSELKVEKGDGVSLTSKDDDERRGSAEADALHKISGASHHL